MKNRVALVVVAVLSLALLFFVPVIGFGIAYLAGWILQTFIGDTVASGLNILFNTDRFTPDMLPLFCGVLGLIGSALKSHHFGQTAPGIIVDEDDFDENDKA